MSTFNKERVNEFFNQQMNIHNITGWSLEFNKSRSNGGHCDYIRKKIFISNFLLDNPIISDEDVKDVILHEIAHILAGFTEKHSEIWKNIALKIGCSGNVTCKNFTNKNHYNYIINCHKGCKNYYVRLNNKYRIKLNYCRKHKQVLKIYKKVI